MKLLVLAPVTALAAFPSPGTAQQGSVARTTLVESGAGGMGTLVQTDFFGGSVAPLGDLDGNGVLDLAVGASGDDDGGDTKGAAWVVFLASDGSVTSSQKISATQGGFTGTLSPFGIFGRRLAAVGDLDGDGISELATTSREPNRLWILFLNPDGTVRGHTLTLFTDPVFVPPPSPGHFESVFGNTIRLGGLAALGDLDGDGLGDLAVGAPGDPDGGAQTGAVWILRLTATGAVGAAQKISATQGSFAGSLAAGDGFGSTLTLLGDLDGDGNPELGIGSFDGPNRFWVTSLAANGTVLAETPYGADDYAYSLAGAPPRFPTAHGTLGDLDGDGVPEVALGLPQANFPGGGPGEGGFAVAFLRPDASVQRRVLVTRNRGGFGELPGGTRFGEAFAPLGDLDGDGAQEIAVGAPQHDGRGGVWILSLAPTAERNGAGVNPTTLSQATEPVLGTPWQLTLDCSAHAPGVASLYGFSERLTGPLLAYGQPLVGGTQYFFLAQSHASGPVTFTLGVPPLLALIDVPVHVQGAISGAPGTRLSNAIDALIGEP